MKNAYMTQINKLSHECINQMLLKGKITWKAWAFLYKNKSSVAFTFTQMLHMEAQPDERLSLQLELLNQSGL